MALIVPSGPVFAYVSNSLTGTPSATVPGSAVTPGTSDTFNLSYTMISAVTHDVEYIIVGWAGGTATSGADNSAVLDVLIDPAGGTSWASTPLIEGLLIGGSAIATVSVTQAHRYHFPIWVKSGTSIGVRAKTSHSVAAANPRCTLTAYGGVRNPAAWWCGTRVETIGVTVATSSGTSFTAGNSGSFSGWTNFGSTTVSRAGAIQYGVQVQSTSHNALGYHLDFGVGGVAIGGRKAFTTGTAEQCATHNDIGPIFCDIQAGSQLQVNGTCSGTAQAIDIAAYLVV